LRKPSCSGPANCRSADFHNNGSCG
jgi:hypothetical protein